MNDFDTRLKSNYSERLSIYDVPEDEDDVTFDTIKDDFEDIVDNIQENMNEDNDTSRFLTVEELRIKAQQDAVHADINGDNDGSEDLPEGVVAGVEEEFEENLVDDSSNDDATQDEQTQTEDAQAELDNIMRAEEGVTDDKPTVDSFLVTQATSTICLGMVCEVINNLAGDGLSLALADGSIPENSDVRKIASKALHAAMQERSLSFKNLSEGEV